MSMPTSDAARSLGVLVVVASLALTGVARAQPPSKPAPSTENDSAFKSGLEQYGRGNYVAAITTWESLLATMGEERGHKVLYNLGLAYQQIGDVTKAIERYEAFLRHVDQPYASPELAARSDEARARLTQLQRTHGAVNVRAPRTGGLVLTRVGSAEPRAAGYVVWLAPGPHTIEIFVGTNRAKTIRIEVVRGGAVDVDTSPPDEPPTAAAAPRPNPTPEDTTHGAPAGRSSTLVLVGAGVTIASVAVPIAFYFVARGKRDDATALGQGNTGYADALSTYDKWRTIYLVSYALPATLAVVTAGVWLFGDGGRGKSARVGDHARRCARSRHVLSSQRIERLPSGQTASTRESLHSAEVSTSPRAWRTLREAPPATDRRAQDLSCGRSSPSRAMAPQPGSRSLPACPPERRAERWTMSRQGSRRSLPAAPSSASSPRSVQPRRRGRARRRSIRAAIRPPPSPRGSRRARGRGAPDVAAAVRRDPRARPRSPTWPQARSIRRAA